MNDYQKLNEKLLLNSQNFIQNLLPEGKREKNEWIALNPIRQDKSIGSFKINLKTGYWADFATCDKGRDFISLYAYLNKCSQFEALKKLKIKYEE
jgi:putative DNA primase/helicase